VSRRVITYGAPHDVSFNPPPNWRLLISPATYPRHLHASSSKGAHRNPCDPGQPTRVTMPKLRAAGTLSTSDRRRPMRSFIAAIRRARRGQLTVGRVSASLGGRDGYSLGLCSVITEWKARQGPTRGGGHTPSGTRDVGHFEPGDEFNLYYSNAPHPCPRSSPPENVEQDILVRRGYLLPPVHPLRNVLKSSMGRFRQHPSNPDPDRGKNGDGQLVER